MARQVVRFEQREVQIARGVLNLVEEMIVRRLSANGHTFDPIRLPQFQKLNGVLESELELLTRGARTEISLSPTSRMCLRSAISTALALEQSEEGDRILGAVGVRMTIEEVQTLQRIRDSVENPSVPELAASDIFEPVNRREIEFPSLIESTMRAHERPAEHEQLARTVRELEEQVRREDSCLSLLQVLGSIVAEYPRYVNTGPIGRQEVEEQLTQVFDQGFEKLRRLECIGTLDAARIRESFDHMLENFDARQLRTTDHASNCVEMIGWAGAREQIGIQHQVV